jgi:hypothetical protein
MADEILQIINQDDKLISFSPTTVYSSFSNLAGTVVWEIGLPKYFGSQNIGDTRRLMAFGDYTGSTTIIVWVKIVSATEFVFSTDYFLTESDPIPITMQAQSLGQGLFIQFFAKNFLPYTIDDMWGFAVAPCFLQQDPSNYNRWAVAQYQDGWFFTNIENHLRYVRGKTVNTLFSSDQTKAPSGMFMEIFQQHLILGFPTIEGVKYPRKIYWSDVHDFTTFGPMPYNESDFYDITVDENFSEFVEGITGIKNLGNQCLVYTPTCIYRLQYVGLPQVMRLEPAVTVVGNHYRYGLIGYNMMHCFVSDDNFYLYDGQNAPKPIGDPIRTFFFGDSVRGLIGDLTQDIRYRYNLWSFHYRNFNEIYWVYVSKSATLGKFDKALVWNYREDIWYTTSVENIHSFCLTTVIEASQTIDSDHALIDTVHDLINDRGTSTAVAKLAVFGTADRYVLREAVDTDDMVDMLPIATPYLETKDISYGNIEKVKEIDTVCISAGHNLVDCLGINVYVAVRDFYDDAVVFTLVGRWDNTLPEKRLSFPRVAGKIFRFKFEPVETVATEGVRRLTFTAWGENVRGAGEEYDIER